MVVPVGAQTVVRFETTMGSFDMVLNPTKDTRLQGYVDNFLHYVNTDRYLGSWINRADKPNGQDFVLQMGGFFSHTKRPPLTVDSTHSVAAFAPVAGVPASTTGLSNTVGTVALALPGNSQGTNQNGGTSSFFVNLGDNSFLDSDFTVFATIPDLTVINAIMGLPTRDLTANSSFGADPSNLGFTDVPIQDDGFQVFIRRAFVVTDTLSVAKAAAGLQSLLSTAAASSGSSSPAALSSDTTSGALVPTGSSSLTSLAVPEPTSLFLAALGVLGFGPAVLARRRYSTRRCD